MALSMYLPAGESQRYDRIDEDFGWILAATVVPSGIDRIFVDIMKSSMLW